MSVKNGCLCIDEPIGTSKATKGSFRFFVQVLPGLKIAKPYNVVKISVTKLAAKCTRLNVAIAMDILS